MTEDSTTEPNLWQHSKAALGLFAVMITPVAIMWIGGRVYLAVHSTAQQYPAYDLAMMTFVVLLAIVVAVDMVRLEYNKRGTEE